ncbi:MAG: ComF family protein [Oscillospiraceae bacterium]
MELINRLISILYPKRCAYCGTIIKPEEQVCEECTKDLPRINAPYCQYCGYAKNKCKCNKKKRAYSEVIAPFYYEGAVKKAIKRMKFSDKPYIAEVFSKEMSKCLSKRCEEKIFDIITCVPMSKKDVRNRGYNQSELLVRGLKVKGNPIIDTELIVKLYNVPPQHSLDATQRQGNVLGIFDIAQGKDVKEKTILLCDDVKTTGATANECASVLLSAGAKEVCLLCAAITKSNNLKY